MKKRNIAAAFAAAAVGLGSVFAALPAIAEDAPPVEIVETVEAVIESPEVIVDEPAPVEVIAAPVAEVAAVAAVTVAPVVVTTAPETVEVWWAAPTPSGGWKGSTPNAETITWPQTYVANPAALSCGVWYQVDTYYAGDVAGLIADGILTNGEDHKVVISWRFVYGGDCPPPPVDCTVGPVKADPACAFTFAWPEPLPPTCDAAGSLPFLAQPAAQNPNGYRWTEYDIYLSPGYDGAGTYEATVYKRGGWNLGTWPDGSKVSGSKHTYTVLPAIGFQSTDSAAPCYVAPPVPEKPTAEPETVTTTATDCDAKTVTTRTTVTTPVFVLVDNVWVKGEPTVVVSSSVRAATATECPTPAAVTTEKPSGLAFTGFDQSQTMAHLWIAFGFAVAGVLLALVGLIVERRRRI